MMTIFKNVVDLLKAKESFVLATILRRCGSAPRDVGSRMIIRADGSIIGTIGGGVLEATIQKLAKELFISRKTQVRRFTLNREGAAPNGMICGGDVDFLLHFEDAAQPDRLALYEQLLATLHSRKRAWLVVELPAVEVSEGMPPTYLFKDAGSLVEARGMPRLRELLVEVSATQSAVVEYEGTRFFIEPLSSEGTVYIFGAGHIGQKLAQLTSFVGFRTVVLDDREEFANRELFGSSDEILVLSTFDGAMKNLEIDKESYLVIVTRGHVHDKTVLEQALRTDAGYIGMIGSRKKRDATYEVLAREGFGNEDFARVHSPIGLNIDAETPEEIAVSIVGELIQARARNR
ncbi:MAG: XdhC family aldehyde oxidoreductase maturation factor [Syntrophobacteraceae bacterium]|jgi:xanthine dehydrogenase accessory factor